MLGGFKFQVQPVNEGAGAQRLPGAWQSGGMFSGACPTDGRWCSSHVGCSPTVCALGQVLAQQAIRILIGATLPGAIRIGKEDLDREPLSQALMLGHLIASIIGQGFA